MSLRSRVAVCCCLLAASVSVNTGYCEQSPPFFSDSRSPAEVHAERGTEFAREGKLDSAETELRMAAKLAPRNSEILATLGTILALQKELEESSEIFRKALQIRPDDLTTRRYLAANLWQLHLYREAKENLRVILKQRPNDKPTQLLLGMVSENSGDYAIAVRMLGAVPAEVRKQPESMAALARSYYHLNQIENARATLARMTGHPAGPQAALLGAQIADEMQDYPTAEKLLSSIRPTFPDNSQIDYTLALVEYHRGHFDESRGVLEKLTESGTGTPAVFNLLGWCYHKLGRGSEAAQSLEQSIKLAPNDEVNYLDLGKILVAQHSFPAALKNAKQTTGTFPNSAAAFETRGFVEAGMGQFSDAVRSYSQAMQLDSSRPDGILGLAQAQFAAGLAKDASASFEAGIKRFPKDARLKTQYAVMLSKQSEAGDTRTGVRAEDLLRSALQLDPTLAEAHYQLGNLALRNGRIPEAQQHLERAVKLDAQSASAHFALSRVYRRLDRKQDAEHEMSLYENLVSTNSESSNSPANTDSHH